MLSGTAPFAGAPPLSSDLPPAVTRLVDLCLSGNTLARPTAADAAALLHRLHQQPAVPAPPPVAPPAPAIVPAPAIAPAPAPIAALAVEVPVVESRVVERVVETPVLFSQDVAPPRRSRLVPILVGIGIIGLAIAVGPSLVRSLQGAWAGTATSAPAAPLATMMMPDRPINEFAIAPDGQRLAFTAVDGGGQR